MRDDILSFLGEGFAEYEGFSLLHKEKAERNNPISLLFYLLENHTHSNIPLRQV